MENNYARSASLQYGGLRTFLKRKRDGNKRYLDITDVITYLYLLAGVIVMFGPILWLIISSFKPESLIFEPKPKLLPYRQATVQVSGFAEPLPVFDVHFEDGSVRRLAQVSRPIGLQVRMIDPENPAAGYFNAPAKGREVVRVVDFQYENYTEAIDEFPFLTYLKNSVIVTVTATLLTLSINSLAAFALSKYEFRGRDVIFVVMLSTLLVPISVILIPAFLVISKIGWVNSLWGLIVPGAATPTGVFLLRQYMLTIPDELLDSARVDGASEWRIYWQIILPLTRPALATLAIFSVMWRWNDFLWPMIVVSRTELFTLPVGLNAFRGALDTQWNYLLAMTVLTLLPITIVFAVLQKFITTGIATTGMK